MLKVWNILITAINEHTHHRSLQVVFTGSSERINYVSLQWMGSRDFPKSFSPFQKPACMKSDRKEVHKLKLGDWLCGLAQKT